MWLVDFTTLASKKRLDKHVLIGELNFPEIRWPDNVTTVDLHKNFLELLMVDLCHSQLITESTHKNGKILDLINWAVITILFLIKIPHKDICIYNSMKRSLNLNRMNFINF